MSQPASRRRVVPLHTQILLGLVSGAGGGVAANLLWPAAPALTWTIENIAQPVGQVFCACCSWWSCRWSSPRSRWAWPGSGT